MTYQKVPSFSGGSGLVDQLAPILVELQGLRVVVVAPDENNIGHTEYITPEDTVVSTITFIDGVPAGLGNALCTAPGTLELPPVFTPETARHLVFWMAKRPPAPGVGEGEGEGGGEGGGDTPPVDG